MAALHDIVGLEDARLDVLSIKVFVGLGGHETVRRQISTFRTKNGFFARETFLHELLQCRPDAAFAALKTIIDRGIDDVDSAFDGRYDRGGIAAVGFVIRLAQISADAYRRHS